MLMGIPPLLGLSICGLGVWDFELWLGNETRVLRVFLVECRSDSKRARLLYANRYSTPFSFLSTC